MALPADSTNPSQKAVLIAMIIATKTTTPVTTDEAMQFPAEWHRHYEQQQFISPSDPTSKDPHGHKEGGRTICLWSLGVLPTYQGRGLGRTLMKSYQQRMETSGIADRIALLARDFMVGMYKGFGFEERGDSESTFAGGGWKDMVYEFAKQDGPGYS